MKNLDAERRLQKAFERLGTNNPKCVLCGETNPHCLELHHPGGGDYSDETIIQCRNCHRKSEDARKDHPAQIADPPDLVERVGHLLLGLADLFVQLVKILRKSGLELIEREKLDATDRERAS